MPDTYIGPVRPMFNIENEEAPSKNTKRLIAGTNSSGMIVDLTKDGLEINAYYTGFSEEVKYAILRHPVVIPWEELEKTKSIVLAEPKKKKKTETSTIDYDLDEKYLKKLPIVTINERKYYIDPEKRERRAVEKPSEVWKF